MVSNTKIMISWVVDIRYEYFGVPYAFKILVPEDLALRNFTL